MNIDALCRALLFDVYYPVTLILSLDERDEIVSLHAVDTLYGAQAIGVDERGASLLVVFSHPDGRCALHETEAAHLRRLRDLAGDIPMRAYICREDVGVFAVDKRWIPGYNGENA